MAVQSAGFLEVVATLLRMLSSHMIRLWHCACGACWTGVLGALLCRASPFLAFMHYMLALGCTLGGKTLLFILHWQHAVDWTLWRTFIVDMDPCSK